MDMARGNTEMILLGSIILTLIIIYPFWKMRQDEINRNDLKGIQTPPLR